MTNSILHFSSEYKNNILNLLAYNEDFVKLIDIDTNTHPGMDKMDILFGGTCKTNGEEHKNQGYIFDHNFVDETTTDEKTFVFVETTINNVYQNFVDFSLYVCIFAKKNLIRLTPYSRPTTEDVRKMGYSASRINGNRIDILCEIADGIINGNSSLKSLGNIDPDSKNFMTVFSPNKNYYGKCLKYNVKNYNISGDCDV